MSQSDFEHPLSLQELLKLLVEGKACQVPPRFGRAAALGLEEFTTTADVRFLLVDGENGRRLQLTPGEIRLNEWGTKFVAGALGDERTLLNGKLPEPRLP